MIFERGRRKADFLLVAGLLLLTAASVAVFWLQTAGPSTQETGTIVSLGNSPGSEGQSAIVGVRTANGITRQLQAPRRLLVGCRVGDDIEIIKRKHSMEVSPSGCFNSK